MKCPDCNSDNPEGMRFCGHCGKPLCNVCPSCGCINPIQFRFCGKCGIPLRVPQAPDDIAKIQKYIPSYLAEKIRQSKGRIEGERKRVTVVFADISGFTSIAETRDPEEVTAVVTYCHTMLGKIIYEYEGIVDKIVGDGLMAIFGIPTHEDDPERAILAAIEMHQGIKALSHELGESMDVSIKLSIGINTGMVVIGDIGTDLRLDYTIMGDVVNTASRLQEEAEPGEILVTQETYQRAVHCFDFQALEPISVKGKSHPVYAYKVIRQKKKPLQARGIEGLRSPLIGRDREFAICKEFADRLIAGKGGVLLITGEAGLGKSRLAEELKEYATRKYKAHDTRRGENASSLVSGVLNLESCIWLEGKCVSYSGSINYWVFMDALKNYFGIGNGDRASEVKRKIKSRYSTPAFSVQHPALSAVSTIVSLLSPKLKTEKIADDLAESEKKYRIFTAVRDVLAAESQLSPLVLALEDLHWADELSIELLLFLIKELSQHRVAFVCIYRLPVAKELDTCPVKRLEEYHSTDASADSDLAACSAYTRVVLNPLSSSDSNMLLKSLLADEALPSEMKRLILGKAGGNPLYLEEVIRSIIDDKAIEHRDGKWLAVKEIEDIEVPSTVQGVIMARIDRLKEEPKHILQCASVIGRSFEYDLLACLVTGGERQKIKGEGLKAESEGARKRGGEYTPTGSRSPSFYRSTLSDLDGSLEELERTGFISREESDGECTFRFRHVLIQDVAYNTILKRRRRELHEMIGSYIEEVHSHHLYEFYEILAYHYSNSNNTEASLSYLIKAGNKNRGSSTGSAESALCYFRRALDILENPSLKRELSVRSTLADGVLTLYKQAIYDGVGEVYKDLGKYEMALFSFETALSIAEEIKDLRMKAKALRQVANYRTQMGDWKAALEAYERSLAIVRELGDHAQMGLVYSCIGVGYFERGDLDEAMEYFREALRIGEQCGDLRLIGDASTGLGALTSIRHDFDEAIRNYQLSLRSYRELGESHYEAQTYLNLGVTHFKKKEVEIADGYYKRSLKISEKCGYVRLTAYTYLNRAEVCLWQSDLGKAKDLCTKAFQILHTLDDRWACAEGYKFYGMIYRRQQNFQSAEEAFSTSLEISRECDHLPNMAEVYCEMGLMCKQQGDLRKALVHFSKSRGIFQELNITEEIQKLNSYIAEVKSIQKRD